MGDLGSERCVIGRDSCDEGPQIRRAARAMPMSKAPIGPMPDTDQSMGMGVSAAG